MTVNGNVVTLPPGMNDARSVNCTGRGTGPHGGCTLNEDMSRFECQCGLGYTVRTQTRREGGEGGTCMVLI